MTLQELVKTIEQLPDSQFSQLLDVMKQQQIQREQIKLTPEQRLAKLKQGIMLMRADLTPEQLDTLEQAVNEKYIEPDDEAFSSHDLPA